MKLGLGRIRKFLALAKNPEKRYPVIHVAGTNGKGSTAAMIASILTAAGYTTGLYTSPHLFSVCDRICLNAAPISKNALDKLIVRYERVAHQCALTFFEFVTGIAFIYFGHNDCDAVVIETGLGGRFDATNVIANPAVCVITQIGRDHQQVLGKRIADIAREKAGIIKKGSALVTGVTSSIAYRVIQSIAEQKKSPVYRLGVDFTGTTVTTDWAKGRQQVSYRAITAPGSTVTADSMVCTVPLLGVHQAGNAAMAIAATGVLQSAGWDITSGDIKKGLSITQWPGRFDVRRIRRGGSERIVVIDGAHNPQAVTAFVNAWRKSPWGRSRQPFIFGILKDKDYRAVIRLLAPLMSEVVVVTVPSPRAVPAGDLAGLFTKYRCIKKIITAPSSSVAIELTKSNPVTAIVGSLYLAGEALTKIK